MHGFGPVVTPGCEDAYDERWEPRIFATSLLITIERLGAGSRRAIREEMAPEDYLRASYYERWLWSAERSLERRGTIGVGEVDGWVRRLAEGEAAPARVDPDLTARALAALPAKTPLRAPEEPRFSVGERVRVRRMRPAGHTRCPRYVRGAEGVVEAVRGGDVFPDIGPYEGPVEPVYAVAFRSEALFGPSDEGAWTVVLDLFEAYLEPA
jgi:nitrile hydratase